MKEVLLVFTLMALLLIVIVPMVNLYLAIITTLEVIIIKNKIKLKEFKKIHKDVF